jgi:hypothetical protein
MSKKEFAEFMSRQVPRTEEPPIDWEGEKKEWLMLLDSLYQMIQKFLAEYIKSGQISVAYKGIELNEEGIGRYSARIMSLVFGTNQISLTPIGTMLIGTKGRVDMNGPRGTRRLLLADRNSTGIKVVVTTRTIRPGVPLPQRAPEPIRKPDWEWKLVIPYAPPQASYQKLTQDAFLDALMEISND